jgi:hypothetical protein
MKKRVLISILLLITGALGGCERQIAALDRSQPAQIRATPDLANRGNDQDPHRAEPNSQQTSSMGEDWHSPGAILPPGPRIVVQRPDTSIQYVTLDGTTAVLVAQAPASLLPAGFDGLPMLDGPGVFVRQWGGGFYVLDTKLGELFPLDFIPSPVPPVAVRPLTEEAPSEDHVVGPNWDISLAWGEISAAHTLTASLYLSAQDGSRMPKILEDTYGSSDAWNQFVAWCWRWRDRQNDELLFTKQSVDGMGGFYPFIGAANLWVYGLEDGSMAELVSDSLTGGRRCLDAVSPDGRLLAHHCDEGEVTLLDLETGATSGRISLPAQTFSDAQLGSVRFSSDGSRIAFAVMTGGYGMSEETQGYILVSVSLNGDSRVVATSETGEWFSVAEWLSGDTLVLQSHNAGPYGWPGVWTVRADGTGLTKLLDGTFLAKFDG